MGADEPWKELGMKLAIMPAGLSKTVATTRLLGAGWNEDFIVENWAKALAFAKSTRIAEQQKREMQRRAAVRQRKDPSDSFDEMASIVSQGDLIR